ncbi:hypothetical protein [Maricaulis sp.]|uniref:hypothetical protein n=1 Tax=Maricaulis sp. TaxID=1486257 RepID=UPI002B275FA2|nr:hypothetical protein [Maricaulis sp.]
MKTLTVSTLVLIIATAGAQAQLGGVTETAGSVRQSTELGIDPALQGDLVPGTRGLSRIEQARADRARRAARRAARAAAEAAPQGSTSAMAGAEASAMAETAEPAASAALAASTDATAQTTTPAVPQPRPVAVSRRANAIRSNVETTALPAPQADAVVRAAAPALPDVAVNAPAPRVTVAAPAPVVRESRTVYVAPAPAPVSSRSSRVETRTEIVREAPAPSRPATTPSDSRSVSISQVASNVARNGFPLCIAALLVLGLILAAREVTRPRGRSA